MNEILKKLHDEPINIYEEQKRLKDQLTLNRQVESESRKVKHGRESLQDLIIKQDESFDDLTMKYRDLAKRKREDAAKFNVELFDYLQQKEQLSPSHPSFKKITELLNVNIISTERSIIDLNESASELEQHAAQFEERALIRSDILNSNQSLNEIIATAYNEINRLRESASTFSQQVINKEPYNSDLKNRVSHYTQAAEELKNSTAVPYETLVQIFVNMATEHAKIAKDYLGIFEEIATSLPKMQYDMANLLQKYTTTFESIDEARDLNTKMRDQEIVENLINGSIGKYMEGDITFINYLNFRGELAVLDIEHVSKEVELGKIKDRGVNYIIDLMEKNHKIILSFQDAFKLRLLLIEYHKVVEVSTKNNKLDYAKNYLNQHASLSAKALAAGVSISPPLRNPSELKNLMQNILEQHSGADGYARDAMLELLDNGISRLPKKSPSK